MRKTSDVTDTDFPFTEDTVPFIYVPTDRHSTKDVRGFEHASTAPKKRALVERAIEEKGQGVPGSLLAVWPGARRSDVFLVDDLDQARAAFA